MAQVHVTTWLQTYQGLVPRAYLDRLDVDDIGRRWRDRLAPGSNRLTWVAEEDGGIVAYASAGPEREGGQEFAQELYGIYVAPLWQARGLGRGLVHSLAGQLDASAGLLVWALKQNSAARGFYEHLGGRWVREHELELDEFRLLEVAYGWEATADLLR